jgi:hypothetical protein
VSLLFRSLFLGGNSRKTELDASSFFNVRLELLETSKSFLTNWLSFLDCTLLKDALWNLLRSGWKQIRLSGCLRNGFLRQNKKSWMKKQIAFLHGFTRAIDEGV